MDNNTRTRASFAAVIAGLLLCIGCTGGAAAAELTRTQLEAWVDGFLPHALEQGDIAGAVVVVVKDGEVLLQKGYGYADLQRQLPVDPERTLFRPGSVSKLFTWTAVMQLVEQGKLDLDRDVNEYLDFQIPPAFDRPITLRHLMTHTPGFEEVTRYIVAYDEQALVPLERYIKSVVPERIFPPGEVPSYSNYGTALAGYIVQRVSGMDFAEYTERHIFEPLGMTQATMRQPLPAKLQEHMSKGYKRASDPQPLPYELYSPYPAGSAAVSGAAMARFMIAHLRAAKGETNELLRPETAQAMHGTMFRGVPPLNGMALGFFDFSRDGRRILWHGGDTPAFHSDLNLLLDEGVGMFLSVNSAGEDGATDSIRTAWAEEFVDRYFPRPRAEDPTTAAAREHGQLLADAGLFQNSRRSETSFFAIDNLFNQQRIGLTEDGRIVTPFAVSLNEQPEVWREVAPFVWRNSNGRQRLAALVEDGRVTAVGVEPSAGYQVRQLVPTLRSASWNVPLLMTAAAVLLLTVIAWPVTALVHRHFAVKIVWQARERNLYRAVRAVAIVDLLFLLGWFSVFNSMADFNWALFEGKLDGTLRLLSLVGLLVIVGAVIALWNVRATWCGSRNWWTKVWSIVLAVACAAIAWIAVAFHLIPFSLVF